MSRTNDRLACFGWLSRVRAAIALAAVSAVLVMLPATPGACDQPNDQFTNVSMMPGAGIAIDSEGNPDGLGALQINVPVAYTPGWGFMNLSAYRGKHEGATEDTNGTGVFGVGFFGSPAVYMSGTQVSRLWAEAKLLSGQISVIDEKPNTPAVSVGVQDVLMKERHSRSLYAVATKALRVGEKNAYATIGYGGGRFLDGAFAGFSMPFGGGLNLAAEWDGYQVNAGIAWRPGGRNGWATVLGAYNGKRGLLVGIGTAFSLWPGKTPSGTALEDDDATP